MALVIKEKKNKTNQAKNLFAEQDKHLSKVNTTTQIVVQVRFLASCRRKLS